MLVCNGMSLPAPHQLECNGMVWGVGLLRLLPTHELLKCNIMLTCWPLQADERVG